MMIIEQSGTWSVNLGRIVVAYIISERKIRVVHHRTGECISEEETGDLSRQEFKSIVKRYKDMVTI